MTRVIVAPRRGAGEAIEPGDVVFAAHPESIARAMGSGTLAVALVPGARAVAYGAGSVAQSWAAWAGALAMSAASRAESWAPGAWAESFRGEAVACVEGARVMTPETMPAPVKRRRG